MEKRVHFFSIYDMSIGYNLVLAEKAIILNSVTLL